MRVRGQLATGRSVNFFNGIGTRCVLKQYTLGPVTKETQWKSINSTTHQSLNNREQGKQYAFRVGVAGPDPKTIYSDVVLRLVA